MDRHYHEEVASPHPEYRGAEAPGLMTLLACAAFILCSSKTEHACTNSQLDRKLSVSPRACVIHHDRRGVALHSFATGQTQRSPLPPAPAFRSQSSQSKESRQSCESKESKAESLCRVAMALESGPSTQSPESSREPTPRLPPALRHFAESSVFPFWVRLVKVEPATKDEVEHLSGGRVVVAVIVWS